jgi:hypothetical protein
MRGIVFVLIIGLSWSCYGAPLQLVRPSEDHSTLELVHSNLGYLSQIKEPISVSSLFGNNSKHAYPKDIISLRTLSQWKIIFIKLFCK